MNKLKETSKGERKKRILEVISNFYCNRYDPDEAQRMQSIFIDWFEDREDKDLKERALFKLFLDHEVAAEDRELFKSEAKEAILKRIEVVGESEKAIPTTNRNSSTTSHNSFKRIITRVVAIVIPLTIIASGALYFNHYQPLESASYSTSHGERESIVLPDKSEVWINYESKLEFEEGEERERIAKLTGEADFKVTKDRKRAFVVKTDELEIKVLGTEFNIDAYPDNLTTSVTLIKGSIELTRDSESIIMEPNQRYILHRESGRSELVDIEQNEFADRDMLVHDLMTTSELLKILERRFGVEVVIEPSVVFNSERYYVNIRHDDSLEFALKLLEYSDSSFRFSMKGDVVEITDR